MFYNPHSYSQRQKTRKRSNSFKNTQQFDSQGISRQDFLQGTGFIGGKSTQQVLHDFMVVKNIIDRFKGSDTNSVQSEISHQRTRKYEKEVKIGPITFKPGRGDWQCPKPDCSNWNYQKRDRCNLCNWTKNQKYEYSDNNQNQYKIEQVNDSKQNQQLQQVKQEQIYQNNTEQEQQEWNCGNCGFQNSAKREECYKCKSSKN